MRKASITFALLLLASFFAFGPGVAAQATPGTIYFDAGAVPEPTSACFVGDGLVYPAILTPPTAAGKAYIDTTTPAVACSIDFILLSPVSFSVNGPLTANIWLGCDAPGVVPPGQDGVAVSWRFTVLDNGGDAAGTVYDGFDQVVCSGAPTQMVATVPDVALEVEAGDMVTGRYQVWATAGGPPPANTWFVRTGDAAAMSGMTAIGIPSASGTGGELISIAAESASGAAPAGGDVLYNLTVTNHAADTSFSLSTSGLPQEYVTGFNPLSGSLSANGTASSVLKVTIPATATPGTKIPFQVMVTGSAGTNQTVALEVNVLQPAIGITSSTSSDGSFTGETSSTQSAPGVELLANVLAIGLLVVALRRRVA